MKFSLVLKYTILAVIMVSCSKEEKLKVSVSFVEFSTDIHLTAYDIRKSETVRINETLSRTEDIFRYFNSEMNPYEESSTLSRLNRIIPGQMFPVPVSLKQILKISQNIYKYTDRSFDIAVQPLVELWGFNTLSIPAKPDSANIKELLTISNLECYKFINDSIGVTDARCRIGLGGIAKGYSVDSAAAFLSSEGLEDFIVAAGGDILVRSASPKTIGIRHPRVKNAVIDTLYISNAAISTSGDYEKYLLDEGERFCHIINPFTGYGTSDCISATVISEKSYLSDAFATAVFVMGREKGRYFIEKNNLSGIIYYLSDDGQIMSDRINVEKYEKMNSKAGKNE